MNAFYTGISLMLIATSVMLLWVLNKNSTLWLENTVLQGKLKIAEEANRASKLESRRIYNLESAIKLSCHIATRNKDAIDAVQPFIGLVRGCVVPRQTHYIPQEYKEQLMKMDLKERDKYLYGEFGTDDSNSAFKDVKIKIDPTLPPDVVELRGANPDPKV